MIRANSVHPESKLKNFNSAVLQFRIVQFSHPYGSVSVTMRGNIN